MDAPTVGGPTVGPRVMGQAAYDRAKRQAEATGGGRVGSRLTGPLGGAKAPVAGPVVDDTVPAAPVREELSLGAVTVEEALARVRAPGADLRAAWLEEHERGNGPRKTVLRALAELGVHAEPEPVEPEVGPAVDGDVGEPAE